MNQVEGGQNVRMSTSGRQAGYLALCVALTVLLLSSCGQPSAPAKSSIVPLVLNAPESNVIYACAGQAGWFDNSLTYVKTYEPRKYIPDAVASNVLIYGKTGWRHAPIPLVGTAPNIRLVPQDMAYDPQLHALILVTPNPSASAPRTFITWLFNGSGWRDMGTTPGYLIGGISVAYDPPLHEIIMVNSFGGLPYFKVMAPITLAFDGSTWTKLHPLHTLPVPTGPSGPPGLSNAVYDPVAGGIVVFDPVPGSEHRMWTFNGSTWAPLLAGSVSTRRPSPLGNVSLGYDSTTGDILLLGGHESVGYDRAWWGDGTWMLSSAGRWRWVPPVKASLPPLGGPFCMVSTPLGVYAIGMMVLGQNSVMTAANFGNLMLDAPALWVFRNDQWQQLCYDELVMKPHNHIVIGCSNG